LGFSPEPTYSKPKKKPGRQRGKDRNTAADGVRQLFELWFDEWNGPFNGAGFKKFFKNDLSGWMIWYYTTNYVQTGGKSHAEYREWRRAFGKKPNGKSNGIGFSPGTQAPKIFRVK